MSTFHTTGLILSHHDFRESDKIFSIYTETHGKIECLAAGVRKIKSKLRAHLEPFSVVDLMIAKGHYHDRLASVISQKSYNQIKSNYQLLIINYQLLELVDQLTKLHHPDPRIFHLLKEVFDYIENSESNTINSKIIASYFILNFLYLLGYAPELNVCVRCKNTITSNYHFNFQDGSVICEKCAISGDQLISLELVEILKKYLSQNLIDCVNLGNDECAKFAQSFLGYHLDWPLKSENVRC